MSQAMWIDGWNIIAVIDSDGHLGLFVTHESGTDINDTGEDLVSSTEFGIRLTCEAVEKAYRDAKDDNDTEVL